MKVVYLVLAIVTSEGYDLQKLKFETTLTCDEIHEAVIEYKDIGERTYPVYQNKIACIGNNFVG